MVDQDIRHVLATVYFSSPSFDLFNQERDVVFPVATNGQIKDQLPLPICQGILVGDQKRVADRIKSVEAPYFRTEEVGSGSSLYPGGCVDDGDFYCSV